MDNAARAFETGHAIACERLGDIVYARYLESGDWTEAERDLDTVLEDAPADIDGELRRAGVARARSRWMRQAGDIARALDRVERDERVATLGQIALAELARGYDVSRARHVLARFTAEPSGSELTDDDIESALVLAEAWRAQDG